MPFSAMEKDAVSRGLSLAKKLLDEVKPIVDRLAVIYDTPTTGLKATITQGDLDSVPSYSELTTGELEDGMYVMTALIKDALNNGQVALEKLAARS